ncbi:hypothetical protein GIB67_002538 [Kingdonia uniflora]|uniref:Helicase ATP-binding domain-containing protein n=1 Tax=Kingdonia uniflora TaxID=39325 RepID=A0A7J7N8W0_9MAGN|nr:hypothetical protein GIB67_002538 [Kingdonia uniflora]
MWCCRSEKATTSIIMISFHRFNKFLPFKGSRICCCKFNHNFAKKLLMEVSGYGTKSIIERSKLLNKVSILMGYTNIQDLLENEKALRESGDIDFSLWHKRFPSVMLGSSSPVILYDGTVCPPDGRDHLLAQNRHGYVPNSIDECLLELEKLSETWSSMNTSIDVESSSLEEESSSVVSSLHESLDLEIKEKSYPKVSTSISSSRILALESQNNTDANGLVLDKPLSCIVGLSSRHRSLLEKCGFHTLRKLLHHFPRTYADLKNANAEVEDGNYLISIGKIISSRGVRASSSFAFTEVVVGCEVNNDQNPELASVLDGTMEKKMIYLHLKKFFRGTRFTNPYFLRSIESKNREGDAVCVSGKVKAMSKKDHYEVKEYKIDVIEDEKDSDACGGGRPYPLYPSKGGLNSNLFSEIILRALQVLSVTIDPIPEDIREEFGLLSLRDAYMGIHHPKDLAEADLARKRLIFDEFFYIQLGRLFQMLEPFGTWIEKDGLLDKYRKHEQNAFLIEDCCSLTQELLKALPYSLTPSQLKAVLQIIWDLKRTIPMNRLLQGDVGCGKTVVAFLACMEVIGSGYQAAFMVPTELLAQQHYDYLLNLLENVDNTCKPSIALLTGSTPARQSKIIRQDLQTGDISLVIGTHSLISESVEFSALRIAIVDEQHRFGVIQRGKFNSKGQARARGDGVREYLERGKIGSLEEREEAWPSWHLAMMVEEDELCSSSLRMLTGSTNTPPKDEVYMAPHVLAMSATPIPRTLALALYGDVSLTQITTGAAHFASLRLKFKIVGTIRDVTSLEASTLQSIDNRNVHDI